MPQKALIYCRVSSKKQTTEGSGLTSQQQRCEAYADQKGYQVDMVFPDDVTGGGNFMKRTGMVAMLSYLKAMKGTHYVLVFDDLKRLSRDTKYYLILREELAKLNVTVECPNFQFEDTPEGQFHETIIAATGELERKQNARQTRQKVIARFEAGFWAINAPLGYKFQSGRNKLRILVRDEPVATIIQDVLEGFAMGRFETQSEVRRHLEQCPDFPKMENGQVHCDTVKKLLTRSVYAGMVELPCRGVSMREGQHDGLIDMSVFNKIQDKLNGKAKAPMKKNISQDFVLRGAVACSGCCKPMTGGWSTGRSKKHAYYTCRQKDCERRGKSIRRDLIDEQFDNLLKNMTPKPETLNVAGMMFRALWENQADVQQESRNALKSEIADLGKQKDKLLDKLLESSNSTVMAACEQRIDKIEREILSIGQKMQQKLKPLRTFDESFRTAMMFLANPHKLWASGDYKSQRALLRLCFTEHLVFDKNRGFRTASKAQPFRVLEGFFSGNTMMVGRAGFEPATN